MSNNRFFSGAFALLCTIFSATTPTQSVVAGEGHLGAGQTAGLHGFTPPPRVPQITQTVNNSVRVQLTGNTDRGLISGHDLGAVADDLQLDDLWLQLQRSPASELALEQLIGELHDPQSPNFHQWLTAAQVGASFGPAQADIDTVTDWLQSQGFTVNGIYSNAMVIDFSGTAADVRNAFQTSLHNYEVNGDTFLSNAADPSIPAALAPSVVGVVSLNSRFPHPQMQKKRPGVNGVAGISKMQYIVPNFDITIQGQPFFAVSPGDFNTIYNVGPAWANGFRGEGQTIVVIEDTNIKNASDVSTFRTAFGLGAPFTGTFSQVHPAGTTTCNNPGVNVDEGEAALDAEWAGVAAPNAAIELASCRNTITTFGGLIAAQNLINGANPPKIMSVSYGECEASNGTAQNNAFINAWQTAAAGGITIFVSSGDEGAASCDANQTTASNGIAVSGFASTPYNVAVGGTDFYDTAIAASGGLPVSTYWNATNNSTFASALSYIPEIPWDDSCATSILYKLEGFTQGYGATGFCNSATGQANFQTTGAGSGGPSNVSAKPAFQAGLPGIVADGKRDIPDVSLFAANGLWNHFLVFCLTDAAQGGAPCVYTNATDVANLAAGGTSFAAPALAGMQALVNQATAQSWGNMNTQYYRLAAGEYGDSTLLNACNSSNGNAVGSTGCIFYDVTAGDIDVNCTGTTAAADCFGGNASGSVQGVLSVPPNGATVAPAYNATSGWDFATGLGTVNASNLVAAMTPSLPFKLEFTTEPNATYASGAPITVKVSVENFFGTVLTGNTSAVTLSLGGGTAGATLGGTKTVNAVAGVATFNNLTVDKVGSNYKLRATDGILLPTVSTGFNITPGTPATISFTTQPASGSNVAAGATIPVVVQVQDAAGNAVPGDNVTLAIGTGPGGATLTGGGVVATDASGNATYSASLTNAGTYTLSASDGAAPTATSNSFNIVAGAAATISFTTQPASGTNETAGVTFAVAATVADQFGNPVAGDNVSLALSSNPGGATLTGGGTQTTGATGSVAYSVSLDKAGSGYTLNAGDGVVPAATTNSFNVVAASAATITFTTQPASATNETAGVGFVVVAHVIDGFGNSVSGDNVSLAIGFNANGATLSGGGTVSTDSSGNATYNSVSLDKAGSNYTLTASDGANSATSNAFNVVAAAPATITFSTQPGVNANETAGVAFDVVATVVDAFGNPVSGDSVTLAFGNNANGATLSAGTNPATTDINGNADFGGVSLDKAGTGYTLNASDGVATSATSNSFNVVAAAPASISFTTEPTDAVAGVANSGIVVTALDAFGNPVAGDNVALSINTGTAGAMLTVTSPVSTDANGNASFTDASLNLVGTYTLKAADANTLTTTSNSFVISPAAAAALVFSVQPSEVVAGVNMSPAVQVSIVDAFGNVETADNGDNVSLALATGTDPSFAGGNATTVTNGVASFSTITLTKAGSGYSLLASTSAGGFTATSNTFTVDSAAADHVEFTTEPSNTTAGGTMSAVVVTEFDTFENVVTSDSTTSVSLTANGPGDFSGTNPVTLDNGVATFSDLVFTIAGNYTLDADASALTAHSTSFAITPGAGAKLAFVVQPVNIAAGGTETVQVAIEDTNGNIVTGDNSTLITLQVPTSCGQLTLGSATVVNGVATFTSSFFTPATNNLIANSTGATSATSSSFIVSANSDIIFANGFETCRP